VAVQIQHAQSARANPELRASAIRAKSPANAGPIGIGFNDRPPIAAQPAVPPRPAVHPNELPPIARPAPSNSGNAKADQKYQQQQDKLIAQQTQERQNLQQKQESQHRPNSTPAQTQQLEQKHSQQTQQLSQKHAAQQQSLQTRQPQARPRK
jgi:hypothetical protein